MTEALNKKHLWYCEHCSYKCRDEESLKAHEKDCLGYEKPEEKFDIGDRVTWSELGKLRLRKGHRKGKIFSFDTQFRQTVRVDWFNYKTRETYNMHFLKKVIWPEDE